MSLDLRELELLVVGIHFTDLISGWCPKHLDDLDKLVHSTVTREYRLTQQQLCHHSACRPDVYTHTHTHYIDSTARTTLPNEYASVEILAYCCTNNANRSRVSLRSTFSNCHVLFRYQLSFEHASLH